MALFGIGYSNEPVKLRTLFVAPRDLAAVIDAFENLAESVRGMAEACRAGWRATSTTTRAIPRPSSSSPMSNDRVDRVPTSGGSALKTSREISRDPFALLVGMLLDQQVPIEVAFRGGLFGFREPDDAGGPHPSEADRRDGRAREEAR